MWIMPWITAVILLITFANMGITLLIMILYDSFFNDTEALIILG